MCCKFSRYQARHSSEILPNTHNTVDRKEDKDDMNMMSTVTNTQVAVKYRGNVGSLSIDMSADNWTTTLGRHIDRHIGRVSINISTDMSAGISSDTSRSTSRPICRPSYRSTVGRYVDRYVGRCVDRYVGRGVHKIHMIQKFTNKHFTKLNELN